MKRILIIAIVLLTSQRIVAQDYAGPDTTICSGSEVMIGIPSSNSTYCYYWDAAEGMPEDQRHLAQPIVSPEHNTVYRVSVRGPMFQEIGSDQTQVFVDFGPVVPNPSYINIGMTDSIQATAELLKDGGRPYTWLVVDQDDTGCFINTFSGEITDCTSTGKFKFKAQAINDLNCDVDGELDVNLGVKEVIAVDAKNTHRKATAGQTLKIVNGFDAGVGFENRTINVTAVPNKGGIFGPGTPEWEGNLEGSSVGNDLFIGELAIPGTRYIQPAEDKRVLIVYEDASVLTSSTSANIAFLTKALDYIYAPGLIDTKCPPDDGLGGYVIPNGSISITEEVKKVEKYGDPGLADARKYTFTPTGIGVCGEISFPIIAYKIPKFGISLDGVIGASATLTVAVAAEYDPSKKDPYSGDVTVTGEVGITGGLKVPVEAGVAGITIAASLSTGAKATVKVEYPQLSVGFEIGGLSGTIQGEAWVGTKSNSYQVAYSTTFFPAHIIAPIPFLNLNN